MSLHTGIGLLYGPRHAADLVLPVAVLVYFHLAVVRFEEPALRSQFGAGYDAYCRRVPRWLPRLA
jgi:protein-S-isoprenylcysteine O-methyltransferase Ste14